MEWLSRSKAAFIVALALSLITASCMAVADCPGGVGIFIILSIISAVLVVIAFKKDW